MVQSQRHATVKETEFTAQISWRSNILILLRFFNINESPVIVSCNISHSYLLLLLNSFASPVSRIPHLPLSKRTFSIPPCFFCHSNVTHPAHLFPSLYYQGDLISFEKSFLPSSLFPWLSSAQGLKSDSEKEGPVGGEGWQIGQFKLNWTLKAFSDLGESDVVENLPPFHAGDVRP